MLICKTCGKDIVTLKDYHTKGQCMECRNKYMRGYYKDNFTFLIKHRTVNGVMVIESDGGWDGYL